jgi:hypothetical protein
VLPVTWLSSICLPSTETDETGKTSPNYPFSTADRLGLLRHSVEGQAGQGLSRIALSKGLGELCDTSAQRLSMLVFRTARSTTGGFGKGGTTIDNSRVRGLRKTIECFDLFVCTILSRLLIVVVSGTLFFFILKTTGEGEKWTN